MSNNQNSISFNLKWLTILIIVVVLILGGIFLYIQSLHKNTEAQVNVNIDKTVIIQKVQKLSKLETVNQTMQRDIEVQIDAGALNFFNVPLLQNKRTQKIAVTGTVTAGVDLNKLNSQNITTQDNNLLVSLPAPEVFNVNIIEDKTTILKDDLTLLFKFQDALNDTRRRELNELLQQQVIKQTKKALVDAACTDNILLKAGDNSKEVIKDILTTGGYKNVVPTYTIPQTCSFEE